ncbi:hypothetical protein HPB50_014073 [Hyalomma asiaticum]|uniref:Uncharacterized protein n=1 Tax=Hyalomma asiaticum TaxID=266040 RepID=A0ACB7S997_HYAAI|nr:hypothetical protein HPB50_014073 [Hyalomma asiaticum]
MCFIFIVVYHHFSSSRSVDVRERVRPPSPSTSLAHEPRRRNLCSSLAVAFLEDFNFAADMKVDKGSQFSGRQRYPPSKGTGDAFGSTLSSASSPGSDEKSDDRGSLENRDVGTAGTAVLLCYRYGLFVFFVSLLMVAVGYGAPAVVRAYALSCTDPGCLEPNAALERSMADARGDPCDDFYGFVCGGWQRENPGVASHFQSLQQRVATAAIMSLVLDEGEGALPSHQVAQLFQRCAQVAFNEQHRIDELRAFLGRFNLSWPTPPPRSKLETLDVMVSLSLDWGVPVFFHLSVDRYFKRPGFRALHFTGNPYMLEWFMARNALQEKGVLLAYFDRVSVILNGSSASKRVVEEASADAGALCEVMYMG